MRDEERARQIGENEAVFRVVNERIEGLNRAFARLTETMDLVCECGDLTCTERIVVSVPDYERIRSDSRTFVVVPGHEMPDVETVIEQGDGWAILRKDEEFPADLARDTDPRR